MSISSTTENTLVGTERGLDEADPAALEIVKLSVPRVDESVTDDESAREIVSTSPRSESTWLKPSRYPIYTAHGDGATTIRRPTRCHRT